MTKTLKVTVTVLLAAIMAVGQGGQNTGFNPSFAAISAGRVLASSYSAWKVHSLASTASGSATMTLDDCFPNMGTNNRKIFPFSTNVPVTIVDGASTETVTPSAIQLPSSAGPSAINPLSCGFTATFTYAHSVGVSIVSGDNGLAEAVNDAANLGAAFVTADYSSGITAANIAAMVGVKPNVQIEYLNGGAPTYYRVGPTSATFLAVPTALTSQAACDATHTFCSDASVAGSASWGSTVYGCVAYVDIMGNEGPCSTTANFTSVASKAIDVGVPAASTGAVGFTIYLSLSGGTYALAYKVPITSSVCTMTTVETITAACAVTNANYNQVGSTFGANSLFTGGAQITGYPVNTARLAPQLGAASTTSDYVPNSNGRTVYAYVPAASPANYGVVTSSLPFTAVTAPGTTVPAVMGSITLPAGFMNVVGRTIRVCGLMAEASAGSTSTVTEIELLWDADGSNTTGAPVIIHGPRTTSTLPGSAADQWSFCQNLKTTVSGAGATAGSIQAGAGFLSETSGANGTATAVGWGNAPTVAAAAVGSLNLAGEARIDVVYLHTTGTDGATPQLTDLTVEVLN